MPRDGKAGLVTVAVWLRVTVLRECSSKSKGVGTMAGRQPKACCKLRILYVLRLNSKRLGQGAEIQGSSMWTPRPLSDKLHPWDNGQSQKKDKQSILGRMEPQTLSPKTPRNTTYLR